MSTRCTRHWAGIAFASLLTLAAVLAFLPPAAATPTSFASGTLVIPMDTAYQDTGMFRAYGLVYRLLQKGVPVRWAIGNPKAPNAFGGVDFQATTIDHYSSAAIGSPYNYTGGPFIIDSADVAVADPIISAWRLANSNLPAVHAATAPFTANVDIVLRSAPRIALESINASIAIDYFNAAGIPDSNGNLWSKASPNILNEGLIACNNPSAASCAGKTGDGALFEGGACMVRKYDIYVTPHNEGFPYSKTDPTNVGTNAYAELDNFVQQGGGWLALCHSILSNEQAVYDLYTNGNPAVKAMFKSPVGGGSLTQSGFPVDPENKGDDGTWTVIAPNLPFAQAVATSRVEKLMGGAVQSWHAPDGTAAHVQYWGATERTAYFTDAGAQYDWAVSGVYHNGSGKGKMSWLGGHSYSTTLPYSTNFEAPYLRFFFNALFFNGAAVANMILQPSVASVSQGATTPLQLLFGNTGAGTATNVGVTGGVTITLQPGISYVGMASGPAPTVTAGSGGTTILTFGAIGDVGGGATGLVINASAFFATTGSKQLATITGTYGDSFGEKFTDLSCAGIEVNPTPAPTITKLPAVQSTAVGDEVLWVITYANPGSAALLNPVISDVLPLGLQFHQSSPPPSFIVPIPGTGSRLYWTLPSPLAAGASGTITLSGIAQTTVGQPFTNNVTLSGVDANNVAFSASASAVVNVGTAQASLTKAVSPPGTVLAGSTLTYSLAPASSGPALLNAVRIFDALPEHTSYVAASANQGGAFGAYPVLPAIDGTDAGPNPATNNHLVAGTSPHTVMTGETVTVTMTLTNNAAAGAITGVTPGALVASDGTSTCGAASPPSIPSIAAAGGTGTFTHTCVVMRFAEVSFAGSAQGSWNSAPYAFHSGTSNTILGISSATGSNVIAWTPAAPNSNTPDVPVINLATSHHLQAPALVTGSAATPATITVVQTLTSTVAVGSVTPGPMSVTAAGTNSPTCTASPLSAGIPANTPVNFTWTCPNVQATAMFGTLVFHTGATGGPAWGVADSNSVLVTPPLTFQVQVDPSIVATFPDVMNTAILSDDLALADGVGSNHVRTPIDRPPEITVIKSVNPVSGSEVAPQDTLTYTLTAYNASAGQAISLAVTDVVPANTTYVPGSCTASIGSCAESAGTVTFSVGTLAGFQLAMLTFQVRTIIPAKAGRYTIPDTAGFTGSGSGGGYSGSSNTVQNYLVAPPRATVVKSQAATNPPPNANGAVIPGATITYTLTVSNPPGAVPATNVVATDEIPDGTTYVAASCAGATCGYAVGPPRTVSWTVGTVPAGGTVTLTFQVTVDNPADSSRVITNAGCIAADGVDAAYDTCSPPVFYPIAALPALSVIKSASPASGTVVTHDQVITYTLVVKNIGNANTFTATVTDAIPANTEYVPNSTTLNSAAVPDPSPGVRPLGSNMKIYSPCCADPSGDGGTLLTESSPGGTANNVVVTFQVKVTTPAGIASTITNQATAGSAATTPVTSNTTTHATQALADVGVTKTVNNATPAVGTDVVSTMTAHNYGPTNATGVTLSDLLPSGYALKSALAGGGTSYDGGTGVWTVGALASGASVTLTITATVLAAGSYDNVVTITGSAPTDPNPDNNTAHASTTPSFVSDLALQKAGPALTEPNGHVAYTLQVVNLGPSPADKAVIRDPAVPNFTVTGVTCGNAAGGAACPALADATVALLQNGGLVLPALPAGGSVLITITGTVAATGTIVNTGSVMPPPGTTDPVPGNNRSTVTTEILIAAIPAVSPPALAALALLLLAGAVAARRRQP